MTIVVTHTMLLSHTDPYSYGDSDPDLNRNPDVDFHFDPNTHSDNDPNMDAQLDSNSCCNDNRFLGADFNALG